MYKSVVLDKLDEFSKKRNKVISEKEQELQTKRTKLRDLEYNFVLAEQEYLVDLDEKKELALEEMKPDIHSLKQEVSDLKRQVKTLKENKYSLTKEEKETIKAEYHKNCADEYEKIHNEVDELTQQYKEKITQLLSKHIDNKKARTGIMQKLEQNCIEENKREIRASLKPMGGTKKNHSIFIDQIKGAYNKAYSHMPFGFYG